MASYQMHASWLACSNGLVRFNMPQIVLWYILASEHCHIQWQSQGLAPISDRLYGSDSFQDLHRLMKGPELTHQEYGGMSRLALCSLVGSS